jgi:hypothetical protein
MDISPAFLLATMCWHTPSLSISNQPPGNHQGHSRRCRGIMQATLVAQHTQDTLLNVYLLDTVSQAAGDLMKLMFFSAAGR